ncbi:MAG: GNAT family N-acetyltransferase [Akkermansiaceae bacterium]
MSKTTQRRAETKITDSLRLLRVSTRDEFSTFEYEWDEMILKSQTPSPFMSWDYLDVWWSVYGEIGYDVHLYIARDDEGTLIGAVPLMVTQRGAFSGARGKFQHLAFMGGAGEMLGESLELPALPGYEEKIGRAASKIILETLRNKWEALYFYLVPEQSISTHAMLRRLKEEGVPIQQTHSLTSPYLRTDQSSWDDFLAGKSKSFRKNVRYNESSATRKFGMKRIKAGIDISITNGVKQLARLSLARWGKQAQAFHTPEFIEFHHQLAPRFARKNQLSFSLMELDGKIAGGLYDFIFNGKMWGYQAPWDADFSKASPGFLLNVWSIRDSFENGLREFDTLPGEDSGYKQGWTDNQHKLNIYEAACPENIGGALFTIARGIDRMFSKKD